jgi:hypothetical protein
MMYLKFHMNVRLCGITAHMYHCNVRACVLYICRCMPENSMVNSDGFNSDPRTFMLHDTVTALGQQSDECSVFMVVGLPLKVVAKASVANFACQVPKLSSHDTP